MADTTDVDADLSLVRTVAGSETILANDMNNILKTIKDMRTVIAKGRVGFPFDTRFGISSPMRNFDITNSSSEADFKDQILAIMAIPTPLPFSSAFGVSVDMTANAVILYDTDDYYVEADMRFFLTDTPCHLGDVLFAMNDVIDLQRTESDNGGDPHNGIPDINYSSSYDFGGPIIRTFTNPLYIVLTIANAGFGANTHIYGTASGSADVVFTHGTGGG